MTELEKACEEAAWEHHNKLWEFEEDSCHRVDFKIGFEAALKPEHMKLTEEVLGLIEVLRGFRGYPFGDGNIQHEIEMFKIRTDTALKPFEKEQDDKN